VDDFEKTSELIAAGENAGARRAGKIQTALARRSRPRLPSSFQIEIVFSSTGFQPVCFSATKRPN